VFCYNINFVCSGHKAADHHRCTLHEINSSDATAIVKTAVDDGRVAHL
jgi:hypothetical protein